MNSTIRRATRELVGAEDGQLARIVALIDNMRERGEADSLIAPLRHRLQRLRLPRPPRLGRLLFAPLDPVIVAPNAWKPGDAAVPRSALAPLKDLVRAALGPQLAALEAMIANAAGSAVDIKATIGPLLWPVGASALRAVAGRAPDASWTRDGLPAQIFGPLCTGIAIVLDCGSAIESWGALERVGQPIARKEIEHALSGAIAAGEFATALLAAVLMTRLPASMSEIVRVLGALSPKAAFGVPREASVALDAATTHLRVIAEDEIPRAPLAEASRHVARAAALLEAMLKEASPRRRADLDAIARSFQEQCRSRFTDSLAADVVAPACALSEKEAPRAVPELEGAARDLRRFEIAARRLGGAANYQVMLSRAAEAIRDLPEGAALTKVDRVRLAEILVGSEQAMQLFQIDPAHDGDAPHL